MRESVSGRNTLSPYMDPIPARLRRFHGQCAIFKRNALTGVNDLLAESPKRRLLFQDIFSPSWTEHLEEFPEGHTLTASGGGFSRTDVPRSQYTGRQSR